MKNPDPLGLEVDPNEYRIVGNNPVNAVDPSGLGETLERYNQLYWRFPTSWWPFSNPTPDLYIGTVRFDGARSQVYQAAAIRFAEDTCVELRYVVDRTDLNAFIATANDLDSWDINRWHNWFKEHGYIEVGRTFRCSNSQPLVPGMIPSACFTKATQIQLLGIAELFVQAGVIVVLCQPSPTPGGSLAGGVARCSRPQVVAKTVRVYRVEGLPNTRVLISDGGGAVAIQGESTLFLNFGSAARAEEFFAQRVQQALPGTKIKSFEVPCSFLDQLRAAAVPERLAATNPGKPILVDVTKAADQFGLRPDQIEQLKAVIIQGTGRVCPK
jgi:hypothetical protein